MKTVAIRADASVAIGTGHVMRCLTLADALKQTGIKVTFYCRPHEGNLISFIEQKGFDVIKLTPPSLESDNSLFHSNWLGSTQKQDVDQCAKSLKVNNVDWLILDHYALDKTWQRELRPYFKKLMVIDDLADREHFCDLLLDQNYGSSNEKYKGLVPDECLILAGAKFALLRPEFKAWRAYSLERRNSLHLKNLLISLGGVDSDNYTAKLLQGVQGCDLPDDIKITVVMGKAAPHIASVQEAARANRYDVQVKSDVSNMAELMANSDLAIGAAGSSSWERCCLGLPTIQIVLAKNQEGIAEALIRDGIVKMLDDVSSLKTLLETSKAWMEELSTNSKKICDGHGVSEVVSLMRKSFE